jgi:hypothetical protein
MKSMKFTIVDDGTEDTVVTVRVIDDGIDLEFMAEPREEGRTLIIEKLHVGRNAGGPNSVGALMLRRIAQVIMKEMGYDELVIEGETRTSGAKPGRRPKPFRFVRDPRHDLVLKPPGSSDD